MASSTVVQYVAVRKDLLILHKWSIGALIAQACHACTAAIHVNRDDPACQQYLLNLDTMHKIVLEVRNGQPLPTISLYYRSMAMMSY